MLSIKSEEVSFRMGLETLEQIRWLDCYQ